MRTAAHLGFALDALAKVESAVTVAGLAALSERS